MFLLFECCRLIFCWYVAKTQLVIIYTRKLKRSLRSLGRQSRLDSQPILTCTYIIVGTSCHCKSRTISSIATSNNARMWVIYIINKHQLLMIQTIVLRLPQNHTLNLQQIAFEQWDNSCTLDKSTTKTWIVNQHKVPTETCAPSLQIEKVSFGLTVHKNTIQATKIQRKTNHDNAFCSFNTMWISWKYQCIFICQHKRVNSTKLKSSN